MKQRLFKLFAVGFVLTALLGVTTGTAIAKDSNIAIKVNGETVKKSEINKQIDQTFKRMKQRYGKKLKGKKMKNRLRKRIRKQVIQRKVDQLVLKTKAKESDATVSDEMVDKRIQKAEKQFSKKKQSFEDVLKKQGMSMDDFRQQVRDQLLVKNFLDSKIGPVSVSDKQVRNFYNKKKKRFKGRSFKKLKPKLKQALKQRKKKRQRKKVVEQLRKESDIDVRI